MVATISRSLRQDTARPKRVNVEQDRPRRPGEMAWKRSGGFPEQRESTRTRGEPVERGFQAPSAAGARRPDQPADGVDDPDRHSRRGRKVPDFGQRAQKVGACQAEQRASEHRQERRG